METATISVALPCFLQADRLLDGDLVERVHRHLDVGKLDARAVGLDADLDVVVDDPLHGHEDLHGLLSSFQRDGSAAAVTSR